MSRSLSNVRDLRPLRAPLFGHPVYDRAQVSEAQELPLAISAALSVLTTMGARSHSQGERDAAALVVAWVKGDPT